MADFKGKNNQGSREIFNSRLEYKAYAYAPGQGDPQVINLMPVGTVDFWWAERAFYGKVSMNEISEPVEPFTPYLKAIKTKKSNVFAMNFVADAFKELQQSFLLELRQGKGVADDSMLSEIEAAKGYASISKQYRDSQQSILKSFLSHLADNGLTNDILNLEHFLDELTYYIININRAPFTRSGFVTSRFCSPLSSALCVEIKDLPYSQDEAKINFIKNPNFTLYRRLVSEHGFAIDKNIPWRLVADLRSPRMLQHAQKYRPEVETVEDVLNLFYTQTSAEELETIKLYIIKMYNQFVLENPRSVKVSHSHAKTTITRNDRSRVTSEKLNSSYSDCKWLELYIRIRNLETGLNYSGPAEKAIIRVAKDKQKTLDTAEAMSYIKIKFSGVEFYEGSLYHEMERRRQAASGEEALTADEIVKDKARSIRKIFF